MNPGTAVKFVRASDHVEFNALVLTNEGPGYVTVVYVDTTVAPVAILTTTPSESFSRRFGVKSGETISLEGIQGPTEFKVGAIFYDYTTEHGLVMMDRPTFLKTFGDRTLNNIGIFIDPDNPRRAELLQEVRKRAEARGLPVLTGAQFHENILEVFDTTFAITRSMRAIAIFVAFFGIAGALLTLFIERSREFGIYRALGFSTGQVAKMTLMEGIGMGLVSFLLSIAIATTLAVLET